MSIFRKKKKEETLKGRVPVTYGSLQYIRFLVNNLKNKISVLRTPRYAATYDWMRIDKELEEFTGITPWEQIMDVDDCEFFTTLIMEHMEMYDELFGKKTIKFANMSPNPDPEYANMSDSGMDLRAWITEDEPGVMKDETDGQLFIELQPGETRKIHTGIYIEFPKGVEGQVRPRSGLAEKHGISVTNSPGSCDQNYRGEICVLLLNTKNNATEDYFRVKNGDRIAQLVLANVLNGHRIIRTKVPEVSKDTDRGEGGFGHSGIK